jgi:two-component system, NtrC family, sensor histidine kinase PilS
VAPAPFPPPNQAHPIPPTNPLLTARYTHPPHTTAHSVQATLSRRQRDTASIDAVLRRELYFFTLYRALEASLLAFLVFSPFGSQLTELRYPQLAQAVATAYMAIALALLLAMRSPRVSVTMLAFVGLSMDIAVAVFAHHVTVGADAVISLLLLVNVSSGAVLLPLRYGATLAMAASFGLLAEHAVSGFKFGSLQRDGVEAIMFAITYVAAALLCHLLGTQLRTSVALADRRGQQVTNLAHLNEMIIRRMRTGVVVVDAHDQIRLMNESAWHLLGGPRADQNALSQVSPKLAARLSNWRDDRIQRSEPLALAPERQAVIPRIATLTVAEELFMIFLDDSSLVSRRAEELTLSSLGRLSAGIAHEIRNPLSAIKHSAQLLEESDALPAGDRRLVEIMLKQCNRVNGIVENVLALARRERSQPEHVDLCAWAEAFVDDYRLSRLQQAPYEIDARVPPEPLVAMVDPQQLHQVVTALVNNALAYGHRPGGPAVVTLIVRQSDDRHHPLLEVIDRGPGIPEGIAAQIFEPFYTTNELGNGLGLYLARQLCEANQAMLEYLPRAAGGSCFRISLASPVPLVGHAGSPKTAQSAAG